MMDLKVYGVGRDAENEQALIVVLNRRLTDEELRLAHDALRDFGGILAAQQRYNLRQSGVN